MGDIRGVHGGPMECFVFYMGSMIDLEGNVSSTKFLDTGCLRLDTELMFERCQLSSSGINRSILNMCTHITSCIFSLI